MASRRSHTRLCSSPDVAIVLRALTVGGAERALIRLAEWLSEQGYRIDLVHATTEVEAELQVPSSVRLMPLGALRIRSAVRPLREYFSRHRPNAVLTTGPHLALVVALSDALASGERRLVLRATNRLAETAAAGQLVGRRRRSMAARLLLARADRIVAPSHSLAAELVPLTSDPSRVEVIPNPLPRADLTSTPPLHPWFAGDPPVVVGCGRLVRQKDWQTLIHAAAICRDRSPVRVLLVGDGPERSALRDLVAVLGMGDHVDFIGQCSEPRGWLAGADVVALTSLWEGQPNVLIEAMSLGRKVVATDAPGGTRELLESAGGGVLVPPANPVRLALALTGAMALPSPEYDLSRHELDAIGSAYTVALGLTRSRARTRGKRGVAQDQSGGLPPRQPALRRPAHPSGDTCGRGREISAPHRIIHLITTAGLGGAEKVLTQLIGPLGEHVDQHVLVIGGGDERLDAMRSSGARVTFLGMERSQDLPRVVRTVREAVTPPGGGCVLQTWLYHADVLGALALRGLDTRVPLVWNLRNVVLDHTEMGRSLRLAYRAARRLSHRSPDRIIACSDAVRASHLEAGYPIDRLRVIPNPVQLSADDPEAGARLRVQLGIPANAPVVCRVARFHPAKDYATFFSAIACLQRQVPDVHVVVCGTETNSPAARKLAHRQGVTGGLHLLGPLDDPRPVFQASNASCSTSSGMEGFPNVVAESIVLGTPVVTSPVGAAGSLVGSAGRVVRDHDAVAYAEAMMHCLAGAIASADVTAQARRLQQEYSPATISAAYFNLYCELAQSLTQTTTRHR